MKDKNKVLNMMNELDRIKARINSLADEVAKGEKHPLLADAEKHLVDAAYALHCYEKELKDSVR